MAVITIDTDEISQLSKEGSTFVMNAEAETSLARLLFIRDKIDEFIGTVKGKIEENALELDENFTGMKGDKVKIEYRAFGAEFKLDPEYDPADISSLFVSAKTAYIINTTSVKEHVKTTGEVPLGILGINRKKQISIKALKKEDS